MATDSEEVTRMALELPEPDRAELARKLLCSLDSEANGAKESEAWEQEIADRVARIQQGKAIGRPAEEVFREIQKRYQ